MGMCLCVYVCGHPEVLTPIIWLHVTLSIIVTSDGMLLTGNQFQVTLREVQGASRQQLEAAAAALKQGGFINYYGLQRFGSGSVPTHRYTPFCNPTHRFSNLFSNPTYRSVTLQDSNPIHRLVTLQ